MSDKAFVRYARCFNCTTGHPAAIQASSSDRCHRTDRPIFKGLGMRPASRSLAIEKHIEPRHCDVPICPYCHSRRVAEFYNGLHDTFKTRPEGSKVWLSPLYLVETRKKFYSQLIKWKLASAYVFYHPRVDADVDRQPGDSPIPSPDWLIRGVLMTNHTESAKARKYRKRIHNRNHIVSALSAWLRYPRMWYFSGTVRAASTAVRLLAEIPSNTWQRASFGVGRVDSHPTMSRGSVGDSRISTECNDLAWSARLAECSSRNCG